jgi:phospholipid-translocating ATPase
LITIITLIPSISPISPTTTVLALLFVLGVSMLKDGLEDYARFNADNEVNRRSYTVIEAGTGAERKKLAQDLLVGDLVELVRDDQVPADLLLLSSSSGENDGACFLETASLDGETNLKRRIACECTVDNCATREGAAVLKGTVNCEPPHSEIYTFKARLELVGEAAASVTGEQLLQRGAIVRNTAWARALVVYCGADTKLSLNAREPPSKFSTVEKRLNKIVVGVFAFKMIIVVLLTIGAGIWYTANNTINPYFEDFDRSELAVECVKAFFSFFAIMSYLIPISLMVSYEIAKTAQALFMVWDHQLMNKDGRMRPKTSNLNDELSLVRWVFSDKTGTLTENRMFFARCSVRAAVFVVGDSPALRDNMRIAPDEATMPSAAAAAAPAAKQSKKQRRESKAKKRAADGHSVRESETRESTRDPLPSPPVSIRESVREEDAAEKANIIGGSEIADHAQKVGEFRASKTDIRNFLLCMSLCHTIVVYSEDNEVAVPGKLKKKKSRFLRALKLNSKKKKNKEPVAADADGGGGGGGGGDQSRQASIAGDADHGPVPDSEFVTPSYSGSSPDEVALCRAAAQNGFAFVGGTQSQSVLRVQRDDGSWHEEKFERLAVMEFTSDRRRMSVIVRMPDGTLELLTKGADYIVAHRLRADTSMALREATQADINDFSRIGLRTLMLAHKRLTEEYYAAWAKRWHEARTRIDEGREHALEELMSEIEQDLELVGCTAIEDALQERVPETIDYLLRANIRVWVITGDKQETAINIGYSSKLLKQDAPLVKLNSTTPEVLGELLDEALRQYGAGKMRYEIGDPAQPTDHLALVIDGTTLGFALNDHPQTFLKLALRAQAVICNRVTPLQKARVVELIKNNSDDVTLSIGDGANDVSMIQAAHVGIGIYGREGGQAARSSDYAIRQFSHLQRLVTVHGRYALLRNAGLVNYFLYKNTAFVLVQAFFAFRSGFSATTIYDDWLLTMYNMAYTSALALFYAFFEKDVSERSIQESPELNRDVQDGRQFSYGSALRWMVLGSMHSLVFYYSAIFAFPDTFLDSHGRTGGLLVLGTALGTTAFVTVLLMMMLMTHYFIWPIALGVAFSLAIFFVFSMVQDSLFDNMLGVFRFTWSTADFWFWMVITVTACLLPVLTWNYIQQTFFPTHSDLEREKDRLRSQSDQSRAPLSAGAPHSDDGDVELRQRK